MIDSPSTLSKPKGYLFLILALEFVFLLLLLKSVALSILFGILITAPILLFLYPEFGFALALTGNVLLKVLFDNVQTRLPIPVVIVYLILISYGVIAYLFQREMLRERKIGKLIMIGLAIGLVMIACLPFSADRGYGMRKIMFYFLFNFPLMALLLIFKNDLRRIENLLVFTFLLGVFLGIFSLFVSGGNSAINRFQPSDSVNPIWLARSLGMSCIAGAFLYAKARRAMPRFLLLLLMAILIYPIVLTGSRGPFLGLILAIVFYYFLQPEQPLSRKVTLSVMGFIPVLAYFMVSGSSVVARITNPNTKDAFSAVSRLAAWVDAIQDFLSSPLLGIGTGGFKMELFWLEIVYPHNLFLELASENGIVGLLLISALIFLAAKYGFQNIRRYHRQGADVPMQLSIAALTILAFAVWNAMFSGDIWNNEGVWFAAGLIWVLTISGPEKSAEAALDELQTP